MLTKKVKKRIIFLTFIFLLSLTAIFFILNSLSNNILYFSAPTEIKQREDISFEKAMRVGGMVKKGSIAISQKNIQFTVTDFENEILVFTFLVSIKNAFNLP